MNRPPKFKRESASETPARRPKVAHWPDRSICNTRSCSGPLFEMVGIVQSWSTVDLRCAATTAGNQMRVVSSANPFTWATSDKVFVGGTHEAA